MAVLRSFLRPLGYFLFDDARIDAIAARLSALLAKFPEKQFTPSCKGVFRAVVTLRQTTLQNVKTTRERKAIGIEPYALGGLEHQGT